MLQNYLKSPNFAISAFEAKTLSKNKLYRYNPETDNFERVYVTWKQRLISWSRITLLSLVLAFSIFILVFYIFDTPREKNLKAENKRLKSQYGNLSKRLDNTMKVMDDLIDRDDNFYRVMMQLEPVKNTTRLIGLNNEERSRELNDLSDEKLVENLQRRMDLLEHLIYSQIESFNELKVKVEENKDKIRHIPSVMPIKLSDYTMSSGYGYRIDPIYGMSKFHKGLDFAAPSGTEVFATADGVVQLAGRQSEYGNCIDIDHGYNYLTRYAHLSEICVEEGEKVVRGQLIGKVGSTGKSTGPHLHYEVRFRDEVQNPVNYYYMDITPEQYVLLIQEAENAGHVMD